jgi:hypothetical protein
MRFQYMLRRIGSTTLRRHFGRPATCRAQNEHDAQASTSDSLASRELLRRSTREPSLVLIDGFRFDSIRLARMVNLIDL